MSDIVEKFFLADSETQQIIKQLAMDILARIPEEGMQSTVIDGVPHKAVYRNQFVINEKINKINIGTMEAHFLGEDIIVVDASTIYRYSKNDFKQLSSKAISTNLSGYNHPITTLDIPNFSFIINDLFVLLTYNASTTSVKRIDFYRISDLMHISSLAISYGNTNGNHLRCKAVDGYLFYNTSYQQLTVRYIGDINSTKTTHNTAKIINTVPFVLSDIIKFGNNYYAFGANANDTKLIIIKLDLQFNVVNTYTNLSNVNIGTGYINVYYREGMNRMVIVDGATRKATIITIDGENFLYGGEYNLFTGLFYFDFLKLEAFSHGETANVDKFFARLSHLTEDNVETLELSRPVSPTVSTFNIRYNEQDGLFYFFANNISGTMKIVKTLSHYEPI